MPNKPPKQRYGSDANGLVWGYEFQKDKATIVASELSIQNALSNLSLQQRQADESFLWLNFSLSNSSTVPWLKTVTDLPEAFYDSLRSDNVSTRLEIAPGSLVAVIHDVLFDFNFDASAVSMGSVFVSRNLLISARLRPLRSIEKLRDEVKEQKSFRSPTDLLAHLLTSQVNVLVSILRKTSARVDTIEDGLLVNQVPFSRSELGDIRRVLVRLQRLLAPEPASFFRLLNNPPKWIDERDVLELRQAAEEFSLAVADTQSLIERVKSLQEELVAHVNEQTNRTLHILTLVTVIALPINLVAGLFGMNVGGVPLTNSHSGFFTIVSLLTVATSLLAYLALIKRRD